MAVILKIREDCHLVRLRFVSLYNKTRSILAVICSWFGQGYSDIFTYKKALVINQFNDASYINSGVLLGKRHNSLQVPQTYFLQ